ncbi:VOC family protein [Terrarubrum flagellatum]|uniref:VOC family protein n=1 Tax=Terrirubrum flagellatum TaxID=2895980 RepID=UPI003144F2C4
MRELFGLETIVSHERPDGSLQRASIRIGDSVVMVADAMEGFPAFPVWLHVYVDDVDKSYAKALELGATSVQEPSEKGDGDRRCGVKDAQGNVWWMASHIG